MSNNDKPCGLNMPIFLRDLEKKTGGGKLILEGCSSWSPGWTIMTWKRQQGVLTQHNPYNPERWHLQEARWPFWLRPLQSTAWTRSQSPNDWSVSSSSSPRPHRSLHSNPIMHWSNSANVGSGLGGLRGLREIRLGGWVLGGMFLSTRTINQQHNHFLGIPCASREQGSQTERPSVCWKRRRRAGNQKDMLFTVSVTRPLSSQGPQASHRHSCLCCSMLQLCCCACKSVFGVRFGLFCFFCIFLLLPYLMLQTHT